MMGKKENRQTAKWWNNRAEHILKLQSFPIFYLFISSFSFFFFLSSFGTRIWIGIICDVVHTNGISKVCRKFSWALDIEKAGHFYILMFVGIKCKSKLIFFFCMWLCFIHCAIFNIIKHITNGVSLNICVIYRYVIKDFPLYIHWMENKYVVDI